MPRIAYVNGLYVPHNEASVHIEDRGFQFADGVYGVIALMNGGLVDAEGHLARLEESMKELKIRPPAPRAGLLLIIEEMIRRNRLSSASIYIQVTRGAAPRDYAYPSDIAPTLVVTMKPVRFDVAAQKKVAKKIVTVPDLRWARRDMKTLMLLAQVMARQASTAAGADDAWLVDGAGHVTEGASNNAWIVDASGTLITRPPSNNMIFRGMTRTALQDLCRGAGLKIVERPFTPEEAYKAREAFSSGAISLIAPVVEIDGRTIGSGKMGPVTEQVIDLYFAHALGQGRRSSGKAA